MGDEKLVKSRQRVADHGEVFTPRWLVDDMLDLVKGETERIDSRFLEPAFMRKSNVSRDTRQLHRRSHRSRLMSASAARYRTLRGRGRRTASMRFRTVRRMRASLRP